MDFDSATVGHCLALLQKIVPYQYSQWVIEDANNHDYRVAVSIIPDGEEGYDIAHRTGVIGQVFRTAKSIMVPDARNHPLYDPFDTGIDWEFCFPLLVDGNVAAVINLEGTGALGLNLDDWVRICRVVEETTRCHPQPGLPEPDAPCLIKTRLMFVRAGSEGNQPSDIVEMARAIARGGQSTLLVGHYPDLLEGRGPTMADASQQGLGVSYCYFGVDQRLDLLATGPAAEETLLKYGANWWHNCNGRYAFVLLGDPAMTSAGLSSHLTHGT
jgi:hypothetical protein